MQQCAKTFNACNQNIRHHVRATACAHWYTVHSTEPTLESAEQCRSACCVHLRIDQVDAAIGEMVPIQGTVSRGNAAVNISKQWDLHVAKAPLLAWRADPREVHLQPSYNLSKNCTNHGEVLVPGYMAYCLHTRITSANAKCSVIEESTRHRRPSMLQQCKT